MPYLPSTSYWDIRDGTLLVFFFSIELFFFRYDIAVKKI